MIKKYCIIHDYGTEAYLKEEYNSKQEALINLENWKKDIYDEYGEEREDDPCNYVWIKEYDLSNADDLEEYEKLKEY
jgi:hypothetical protein